MSDQNATTEPPPPSSKCRSSPRLDVLSLPDNPRSLFPSQLTFLTLPSQIRFLVYALIFASASTTYIFAPGDPSSQIVPFGVRNTSHINIVFANKTIYREASPHYFQHAEIIFRGLERIMHISLHKVPIMASSVVNLALPVHFMHAMARKKTFRRFIALKRIEVEVRGEDWVGGKIENKDGREGLEVGLTWEGERPEDEEILKRVLSMKGGEIKALVGTVKKLDLRFQVKKEHESQVETDVAKHAPVLIELPFVVKVLPRIRKEETSMDSVRDMVAYLHYVLNLRTKTLFHEETKLEWI